MIKNGFLFVSCVLLSLCASAQAYVHTYGGASNENFRAIAKHPQGGFVALGTTGSELNSQTDMYLVRVDDQLGCMWSLNLGGGGVEQGEALSITSNGAILAVGYSVEDPTLGYQNYAVLVDANGQVLWEQRWGDEGWDLAACVAVDSNDEFWIASNAISTSGDQSITLNHLNLSGNVVGTFVANSAATDEAVKLKFYNDSLYLLMNTSDVSLNTTSIKQIALNGGLGQIFASTLTNVKGYDFDISEYGILLAGSYFNSTVENYYAILFDAVGNTLAEHQYSMAGTAYYTGVTHNSNSFNLVGITNSIGAGQNDVIIQRFGPNADWWGGGTIGTPALDESYGVICSSDTLYAVGYSNGFETGMQNQATITKTLFDLNNLTAETTSGDCFFVGISELSTTASKWRIAGSEAIWSESQSAESVRLYSVTGACLYAGVNVNRVALNIPSGVYFLHTVYNGEVSVQSFIR